MFWPSIGLLSILGTWAGLIYLIRKWKGNESMTFSQHAAQYQESKLYYALMWLIVLPPFFLFMNRWFSSNFQMGVWFDIFVVLASLGMLVAALIPETNGWKVTVHRFSAFSMATFMYLIVLFITFSLTVSDIARVIAGVSSLVMICQIILLTKHKRYHPKMLLIQGSYSAMFHISILAATFV